eukprot:TRINITY_DN10740_c0_g1_i1.p1 TRINITY_DN10740_c0_g1~~TRINITY_DN10740_c0_g1_i1.p1  ORF type:complete len:266 (-),score=21.85 TRINITY_DN10740_c0_g1_i1:426-1118(-)
MVGPSEVERRSPLSLLSAVPTPARSLSSLPTSTGLTITAADLRKVARPLRCRQLVRPVAEATVAERIALSPTMVTEETQYSASSPQATETTESDRELAALPRLGPQTASLPARTSLFTSFFRRLVASSARLSEQSTLPFVRGERQSLASALGFQRLNAVCVRAVSVVTRVRKRALDPSSERDAWQPTKKQRLGVAKGSVKLIDRNSLPTKRCTMLTDKFRKASSVAVDNI